VNPLDFKAASDSPGNVPGFPRWGVFPLVVGVFQSSSD